MLKIEVILSRSTEDAPEPRPARLHGTLTLPFELRQRSRLVARLDDGGEVALSLPRGSVLRSGALLQASDGSVIEVRSAPETLSCVQSRDPSLLARAAYHLGNRHVPLQIEGGRLCYEHDHVLDDMLRGLGLHPELVEAPFEPEAGAYAGGSSHRHHHPHDHEH